MFNDSILPIPLYVVIPAMVALYLPFRLPRVGLVIGAIVALIGALLFTFPASSGFWRDLFAAIDRALGMYLMVYGGLWLAIGGVQRWRARRPATIPV